MIAYVFTASELKVLCQALKVNFLAKHQFSDTDVAEDEFEKAFETLKRKYFITQRGESIIINSGIAVMLETMGTAAHLIIGDTDRIFTAYLCSDISILLINDTNSKEYMLYPFKNENALVDWLHDNNIYTWKDIRLEDR